MKRIKPTHAMLVAVIALFVALGGGAAAGVAISSLDKKEKKQVTKIAKKQGKQQANKRIDKREPKLNVNSAKSAEAVNGQRIVPINHRSGDVTNATLASLNGITVRVSCTSGNESISVVTTVPDGEISAISNDAEATDQTADELAGEFDDDFGPGETFDATSGASASERQYTLTYSAGDGRNVTATFVTEDRIGGDNDCVVSGYAVG